MKPIFDISPESRVWIYQADRFLSEDEAQKIRTSGAEFIEDWSSHGSKLEASLEVFHNRFIVIAANEARAMASGCGIDKSVQFIKVLGSTLGIDFFQRTQVIYRQKGELTECPLNVFWASRKAGLVNDDTVVFDNTVRDIASLNSKWEVPFSQSWHAEMWSR